MLFEVLTFIPVSPLLILKLAAGILLFLHLAFSVILLRQTKLMISVVEAKISFVIYFISLSHLLFSVFVIVWLFLFV